MDRPLTSLGSSVAALRHRFGLASSDAASAIELAWQRVAGPGLVELTDAIEVRDEVLRIVVRDPGAVEAVRWRAAAVEAELRAAADGLSWQRVVVRAARHADATAAP